MRRKLSFRGTPDDTLRLNLEWGQRGFVKKVALGRNHQAVDLVCLTPAPDREVVKLGLIFASETVKFGLEAQWDMR